jgi:hypothetical protein
VQETMWLRKGGKKINAGVNKQALRFLGPNLRKETASDIPRNKGRPLTLYMMSTIP